MAFCGFNGRQEKLACGRLWPTLACCIRQRASGWAIRAIMEEASFVPASSGINTPNDRLFSKDYTYKYVAREHRLSPEILLARILETLTTAGLEGVKIYVEQKLFRRPARRRKEKRSIISKSAKLAGENSPRAVLHWPVKIRRAATKTLKKANFADRGSVS